MRRLLLPLLTACTLAACGKDSTGPTGQTLSIAVQGGSGQFGTASNALADPLQAVVTDAATKRPVEGVTVRWSVVQGTGADVQPVTSVTAANGVASATVRLGSAVGTYAFQATVDKLVGSPARFDARAVLAPAITAINPRTANPGDTVTIAGSNFSTNADENVVLFGGFRGKVVSATTTQLRVVVPRCLPGRTLPVVALLGAVGSPPDSITVRASTLTALQLARGEARLFTDVNELGCQRVTAQFGTTYLIIPQNYSDVVGNETGFELRGLSGGIVSSVTTFALPNTHEDFASTWELKLRARERAFPSSGAAEPLPSANQIAPPNIGDRKQFKVYNKNEAFTTITAEVKAISDHAIIYQDVSAPANGFVTSDFQQLGASFDAPTYDTDVQTFGAPSDIDANGKVIIVLSPVVNELTPRGSSSFISGFFFGCDLQTVAQCSGSNLGEVFYLFVPDPSGQFGDVRSRTTVFNAVRPVLAHEFQHMINFSARKSLDALWLSEGMAHMAEEVVGGVYAAQGDPVTAQSFRSQNYERAKLYFRDSTSTSLLDAQLPGSLELRGGAWLVVMYLAGQYGNGILRTMTQSTISSVQNIVNATGKPWSTLLSEWSVALWADDAPDFAGVTLKKEYTFPNINLRSALSTNGVFTLRPTTFTFGDFVLRGTLRASSQRHVLLDAGALAPPTSLSLTGARGGAFAPSAQPQITILRVR